MINFLSHAVSKTQDHKIMSKKNKTKLHKVHDIKVTVKAVFFSDAVQGFCIFRVMDQKKEEFTCKGHVGTVNCDDEIIISGAWEDHPKYGKQLKITGYKYPDITEQGILSFLQSGFIKGVGQSLAKAICDKFKENTEDILDNHPEKLLTVSGIGEKKLENIKKSWHENKTKRESVVRFQEWGIGPMTIQKILKKWPDDALKRVKENPYILAWEIDNVGFLTADKIASSMGTAPDSPDRVQAGLKYILQETSSKEGHCYLKREDLVDRTNNILWPDKPFEEENSALVNEQINYLVENKYFANVEEKIYNMPVYRTEQSLCKHIVRLMQDYGFTPYSPTDMLKIYERRHSIQFDDTQKKAIETALNNKVCIITGGPGTGKTTIVNAILSLATEMDRKTSIGLVAPTGRAAKRLEENTNLSGQTIHRYLGYNPHSGFEFDDSNQVEDNLIVCDEASMLDVFLAKDLVCALPDNARLILVGDVHQLPSVGAGNVLRDCINSHTIPTVELNTIHRQSEGSVITYNAHCIKNGDIKGLRLNNYENKDFFWFDLTKENQKADDKNLELQNNILHLLGKLLEKGVDAQNIQVLSPMHKGLTGVANLNEKLQSLLNPEDPQKKEVQIGYKLFREGDKVMQLKNDYNKEVFNGDQGFIRTIDKENNQMDIVFNGTNTEYDFLDTDKIALAYACTIHKSQGSEYPFVIMPVTTSHYIMLQRNLIYTGVTRAKKMCVLAGEKKALAMAIKNNKPIIRNTNLQDILKEKSGEPIVEEADFAPA